MNPLFLVAKASIVTFWKRIRFLIVRMPDGIDYVTFVRAKLVTARFNVPCVHKLLFATLARVVVLHLNLHNPRMVHVFGVTVHTQIHTKALRTAEIRNPQQHGCVLVLAAFTVDHLRVVTTLHGKVETFSTIRTMLHYCLLCLSLISATRMASSISVSSSCFANSRRASMITLRAKSYSYGWKSRTKPSNGSNLNCIVHLAFL